MAENSPRGFRLRLALALARLVGGPAAGSHLRDTLATVTAQVDDSPGWVGFQGGPNDRGAHYDEKVEEIVHQVVCYAESPDGIHWSKPDLDLVEFEGIVWGIIPAALDHAPIIANNILGNEKIYHQTIPKNTLKVVDIYLTSMGKVIFEGDEEKEYEIVKKLDQAAERYEKYVIKAGILVGAILLGSNDNLSFVRKNIGKEVTRGEIEALLW